MRRLIEGILIAAGGVLGAFLAQVRTTGEFEAAGTAWSLTMLPGLIFIVPLGGVHGFLAEVIWPVILGCNALAYALIAFILIFGVRRLFAGSRPPARHPTQNG
jgi:hypothetical protein